MIAYVANVYLFGIVLSLLVLGAYRGYQRAESGEFETEDIREIVHDALGWPLLFAVPAGAFFTLLWRSRHNYPASPLPGTSYEYSISFDGEAAPATPCTVTVLPPVDRDLAAPGFRVYRTTKDSTFIGVSKKRG